MESLITFVCALIILWALEIRFRDYKRSIDTLNNTAQDLKNKLNKMEEDMVNIYLRKK